jgi:folate-binding protein YgfZ
MTGSLKAAFLRDRSVIAIGGADRIKFLQGLVTNDIRRLAGDHALYAGFLTGQGKLICDLFVVEDGDQILVEIATMLAADFFKRLAAFKLRAAVEFGEAAPPLAVAVVWGTEAATRLGLEPKEGAAGKGVLANAHCAFVDPRIAALGVRIVYPAGLPVSKELASLEFAGAAPADYAAHRLGLGVADAAEIGGEVCYPLEANFEALHGVDFKKGCYVGQELTARMKLKGQLRKRILPVTGTVPLPPSGTPVTANGKELGALLASSGTQGLALLRLDHLESAQEGSFRAREVPLIVGWPSWLPR